MLSCHSCKDEFVENSPTERIIDICPGSVVLTVIIGKQQRVSVSAECEKSTLCYILFLERDVLQSALSGLLDGDRQNGLKRKK